MRMDSSFEIPSHAVARRVGDDMVILDLVEGRYLTLDPVGGRIWELLSEGRTLDELCARMLDEYDVARERLEADIVRLVGELSAQGLVEKRQ
jgi:hypothetical protein